MVQKWCCTIYSKIINIGGGGQPQGQLSPLLTRSLNKHGTDRQTAAYVQGAGKFREGITWFEVGFCFFALKCLFGWFGYVSARCAGGLRRQTGVRAACCHNIIQKAVVSILGRKHIFSFWFRFGFRFFFFVLKVNSSCLLHCYLPKPTMVISLK